MEGTDKERLLDRDSGSDLTAFSAHLERAVSTIAYPSMKLAWHDVYVEPKNAKHPKRSIFSRIGSFVGVSSPRRPETTPLIKPQVLIERHCILDHCYGVAYPGEVMALMGASGAGKTTLMNVLAQRNLDTVNAAGALRLNGVPASKTTMRKLSAYVQQDDLFIGTLTVKEHLTFTALMKMGKFYSSEERAARVDTVMGDLGLTKIAKSVIGNPRRHIRGISGGEKKRLAFASEILTSPPLLFCDEPTSGLDSFMARQTIMVLKQLAKKKNMTIIVTIHQPSSPLFALFDRVCFMAEGRTAFLGTIPECIRFWKETNNPVPEKSNPADHFITSLAIRQGKEAVCQQAVTNICNQFDDSELGKSVNRLASEGNHQGINDVEDTFTGKHKNQRLPRYHASWCQQFWGLMYRSFIGNARDPVAMQVRVFQTVLIAFLVGLIYYNTNVSQSTVMSINGLLFECIANMNFMFQFTTVNIFCDELPTFLREHQANLYRVETYFLAKNLAESVQYVVYPSLFASILYWFAGLVPDVSAFGIFALTCVMITNVGISISYFMSCLFGNIGVAINVMPVIVIPLMAFGGFFINIKTLPTYFQPIEKLSYFAYGFEILTVNEWSRIDNIPGCKSNTTATSCYGTGENVIKSLGFHEGNIWRNLIMLALLTVVIRFFAYLFLWIRTKVKK